jgi:hypothetical protein
LFVDSASCPPVPSTLETGPGMVGVEPDRVARLRAAALAGPAGAGWFPWESGERAGLLAELVSGGDLLRALSEAGHTDGRRRALPGEASLAVVLALTLHGGEGYPSVLAKTVPHLFAGSPPGAVPSASALSQARARLGSGPVEALFAQHNAARGLPSGPGSVWRGMVMTGFDGTCVELARQDALIEAFGAPTGALRPQARLVTLAALGDRRIIAAAIGAYTTSEQELVDGLAGALGPGTVNVADRNFFSMRRFLAFSATGAHLVWRVKNDTKSLPARITARLPDGSYLVRLRESAGMLTTRRRDLGERGAPRLPDTTARMIEFDVRVTSYRATARTSRVRLLTTLLDWRAFPATALAQLYAERWQVEITYLRLKSTLRGDRAVLRGHSPDLVRQELWALMTVYNILSGLAADAAALEGIDPDEISFVSVLRLTRAHLGADLPCTACGHRQDQPKHTLTNAIATSPRNRTDRKRTSPRTPAERRTQRTRNARYTITIAESNLPEADQSILT